SIFQSHCSLFGVAFDYAGQLTRKAALISAAYYNLQVGALSAIPAVATGLMAWQWQFDGRRLHGILLLHLVLGTVGSEEARLRASLRPPLKLHVRFSRMQLSRRHMT